MQNKKAYMKTVEVMISIAIVLVVLSIALKHNYYSNDYQKRNILQSLKNDLNLRACVITYDNNCTSSIIASSLGPGYNYTFQLVKPTSLSVANPPKLPPKTVFVDSYYFSGNLTNNNDMILKLYYWRNK